MRAAIFDCYDDYEIRVKYVYEALTAEGYETDIYFSDFDHMKKAPVEKKRQGVKYINALPYKKNLSPQRLISHLLFAVNCRKTAQREGYDLVYVVVPPNSLVRQMGRLRKHKTFTLIFDVCDLWPETFPSSVAKKLLSAAFALWKAQRKSHLKYADFVITECNLFYEKLTNELPIGDKTKTVYLCKNEGEMPIKECSNGNEFLYLGSINNIIDIDFIASFMKKAQSFGAGTLNIIGEGEKSEALKKRLSEENVAYIHHGAVYEQNKKDEIMAKCSFGLNIMKKEVCVGLTMKSLDYFSRGLIVINNIKGDTFDLISQSSCGFNVENEGEIEAVAKKCASLTQNEINLMKKSTMQMYQELFLPQAVVESLRDAIRKAQK